MALDPKTRAELIRQGNAAFNSGDYPRARDLFTRAAYKAGLVRMGDYYMHEMRLPLLAYGYYRRAGAQDKIEDLHRRMIGAMGQWLGKDKLKEESQEALQGMGKPSFPQEAPGEDGMIGIPVSPLLRETALKILAAEKK